MMTRRTILSILSAAPLVQMQQTQADDRRRVIPMDVIIRYKLQPTRNGYGPWLRGEDGKPYDFDDVVAVLFEMTREHWQLRK